MDFDKKHDKLHFAQHESLIFEKKLVGGRWSKKKILNT